MAGVLIDTYILLLMLGISLLVLNIIHGLVLGQCEIIFLIFNTASYFRHNSTVRLLEGNLYWCSFYLKPLIALPHCKLYVNFPHQETGVRIGS